LKEGYRQMMIALFDFNAEKNQPKLV